MTINYQAMLNVLNSNVMPDETDLSNLSLEELVDSYHHIKLLHARVEAFKKLFAEKLKERSEVGDVITGETSQAYEIVQKDKYTIDKNVVKDPVDIAYLIDQLGPRGDYIIDMVPSINLKELKKVLSEEEDDWVPDGIRRTRYLEIRAKKSKQ